VKLVTEFNIALLRAVNTPLSSIDFSDNIYECSKLALSNFLCKKNKKSQKNKTAAQAVNMFYMVSGFGERRSPS
jgi:hypothetical protein